jgi:hypothetical protein
MSEHWKKDTSKMISKGIIKGSMIIMVMIRGIKER